MCVANFASLKLLNKYKWIGNFVLVSFAGHRHRRRRHNNSLQNQKRKIIKFIPLPVRPQQCYRIESRRCWSGVLWQGRQCISSARESIKSFLEEQDLINTSADAIHPQHNSRDHSGI